MVRSKFSSPVAWLVAAVVCMFMGFAVQTARAQTPTADQLEILQSLSPDQQRAILEALGQSGSDAIPSRSDRRPSRATTDTTRRDLRSRERRDREGELEREPRFKKYDTLLLSLQLREFKGQDEQPAPGQQPVLTPQPGQPVPTPPVLPTNQQRESIVRTDTELDRLEDLRTRILRRNPIQLDKWGILAIPELGTIPLAGLTAQEARQRIAAEPVLADFIVQVTYLPVEPLGTRALKFFGHDLFEMGPDAFAPSTDIPVPAEYVIGPGDNFEVQLIGSTKGRFSLVVRRDGRVNFPELGPIPVAGLRFEDARAMLEQRVSEQLIGTQASVQMSELRSIQVFVVGEVMQPGSYTVSGLSTVTNALFVSGGVKETGSLRHIELKRAGRTVTRFDLYDLLLKGDARADLRLQSGDVILIPTVGPVVGVSGEVRRPAFYELNGEQSAGDLVRLAGGMTSEADGRLSTLERIGENRQRTVVDIDLTSTSSGSATRLDDGDMLHVPSIRPTVDDSIVVQGHVHRPGTFQHRPGLRITDILPSFEELRPMADPHYVLIRREIPPSRRIEYLSADLAAALANPGTAADVVLEPRDQVFVFDMEAGRTRTVEPLLRELKLQSTRAEPTMEVSIGGRVNMPGQYPLERGMRVSDLLRAGGSLNEAAYGGKAELTRNSARNGEVRETELIEIDLGLAMAGDPAHNVELQSYDHLVIKELPLWGAQEYVEVEGEVRFPGRYPIQRGETLKSVVQRAGGMTDLAFSRGTVFTRESLKERERQQIDDLTRRLQTDLAQVSLMAAQEARGDAAQALAVGQQLLDNLRDSEPVGRLVINLDRSLKAREGTAQDIVLKDGDRLLVPRITQEVTVIGEVQSPTSHLYADGYTRGDYIELSGGMTQRADDDRIYVVRADGSVVSGGRAWFSGYGTIQPGDTVVVPLDAERMRALPLWTAVTTIIYNLAVAVAAVNSF